MNLVNIKDWSKLDGTLDFLRHALLAPTSSYVGMCDGTSLTTAPFRCDEGVYQGAIIEAESLKVLC